MSDLETGWNVAFKCFICKVSRQLVLKSTSFKTIWPSDVNKRISNFQMELRYILVIWAIIWRKDFLESLKSLSYMYKNIKWYIDSFRWGFKLADDANFGDNLTRYRRSSSYYTSFNYKNKMVPKIRSSRANNSTIWQIFV